MIVTSAAKSAFAGALDRGSFFLFTLILAREASLEVLGLFSFLFVSINVIVNPLAFALNSTYTRLLAEESGANLFSVLSDNLVISVSVLGSSILLFLATNFLSAEWAPEFPEDLFVGCIFLAIAETLRKSMVGIYIGLADFNSYVVAALTFSLVLNIYILQVEVIEVKDTLIAHAVSSLAAGLVGLFLVITKKELPALGFLWPKLNTIKVYLIPSVLSSFVPALGLLAVNGVVSAKLGIAALGLFAIGNQLRFAMAFMPAAVDNVYKSKLVRKLGVVESKNTDYFNRVFFHSATATFGSGLVVMCILLIYLPLVIKVFDVEYIPYLFTFFVIAGFIQALSQTVSNAILSRSSFWLGFRFNCIWILCFLFLLIYFIGSFGIVGISLSMLGAYLVLLIVQVNYLARNWSLLCS